jgi:hypothetical protein
MNNVISAPNNAIPKVKPLDIISKFRYRVAPVSYIVNTKNQTQKRVDQLRNAT